MIPETYGTGLSLLTDLYQLTMGYGYWQNKMHQQPTVFHLFFRQCPFDGQYAIAAGLEPAVEWLRSFQVTQSDVDYLRELRGNDAKPLFHQDFLTELLSLRLTVDIDAIPEGTVVFAHEPLVRVTGPLWQCQWIETALLNIVNFQTLIATKAARVCDAAEGEPVLEFGLRRAQGIDGGLSAARAAYVGGCTATSNVLAGKLLGIPVKGTHAHSWIMAFDDELTALSAYADAMPNNCVFLVDTYDTIGGVKLAIQVGHRLRESGHEMVGIRLDSGDLAQLSIQSRRLLDEAGFPDAVIVASNDLDEYAIARLKRDGAKIAVWGVGTNLVTARDQPALGGVYKLAAIADDDGRWQPRIKLSELAIKTSTPGIQQVRRYYRDGQMAGDAIYSELIGPPENPRVDLLIRPGELVEFAGATEHADLLIPVLRGGQLVAQLPALEQLREYAIEQRSQIPSSIRGLNSQPTYATGLEVRLAEQKRKLIGEAQST
ncbi:MAG: nicotinate phosphoribosyltransferase [Pirellulaceae bacterium]|nr:nicotinate phosphoribosyltransferase [Pirellulaceae bacterium]